MQAIQKSDTEYSFRANSDENLLSEVDSVHCVLFPKTLLVAGFDKSGSLLTAHYNRAGDEISEWDTEFFEQDFINEKLLGVPQQVKAIFIGTEKSLIVPGEIYQSEAAEEWLARMFTLRPDSVFYNYFLKGIDSQYTFVVPPDINKLVQRYFGNPKILPAAAFHFQKSFLRNSSQIQLLITKDKAVATLMRNGQLFWHRHFAFQLAEDLAFFLANVLREFNLDLASTDVECCMMCENCEDLGLELERYFPKFRWTRALNAARANEHLVFFAERLFSCVL